MSRFPTLPEFPLYIDLDEASHRFGPSKETLRQLIYDDLLVAGQFGGRGKYYVLPADVLACLKPVENLAPVTTPDLDELLKDIDTEFRTLTKH